MTVLMMVLINTWYLELCADRDIASFSMLFKISLTYSIPKLPCKISLNCLDTTLWDGRHRHKGENFSKTAFASLETPCLQRAACFLPFLHWEITFVISCLLPWMKGLFQNVSIFKAMNLLLEKFFLSELTPIEKGDENGRVEMT